MEARGVSLDRVVEAAGCGPNSKGANYEGRLPADVRQAEPVQTSLNIAPHKRIAARKL